MTTTSRLAALAHTALGVSAFVWLLVVGVLLSNQALAACSGSWCGTVASGTAEDDCQTSSVFYVVQDDGSTKVRDYAGITEVKYGTSACSTDSYGTSTLFDAGYSFTYYRDADSDEYYDDSSKCCVEEVLETAGLNDLYPSKTEGTLVGYIWADNCTAIVKHNYYLYYCDDVYDCDTTSGKSTANSKAASDAASVCGSGSSTYAYQGEDCDDNDATVNEKLSYYPDDDGDGYGDDATGATSLCPNDTLVTTDAYVNSNTDCDDADSAINPGPTRHEVCDTSSTPIDEDCDGETESDDNDATGTVTYYPDLDGDGYGDEADLGTDYCPGDQPSYFVRDHTDCNDDVDEGPYANPDLDEACLDEIDNDCDGTVDEDDAGDLWYRDSDGDGYGESSVTTIACEQPADYVNSDGDCDDDDSSIYPGADELCSGVYEDCDSRGSGSSAPEDEVDEDSDGYVACAYSAGSWKGSSSVHGGDDCEPADGRVYPGASETCDGQYNDCDDGDYSATSAPDDEQDDDGDTYVECDGYARTTWQGPSSVKGDNDCDDGDDSVYAGASEICDGQFNDCDDSHYAADKAPEDELDDDGDGYVEYADCTIDPATWKGSADVVGGDDCDDDDDAVFAGNGELCDGQYNDCSTPGFDPDGAPDDEVDDDGDYRVECHYLAAEWAGYSGIVDGDDCDDTDKLVYDGAEEICDGQYNDCGDRSYDASSAPLDEQDADADGYAGCDDFEFTLWDGDPSVEDGGDCDDEDASVHPDADEICDGQYNDCENLDYDPRGAPEDELDGDGDGYVSYVDCAYDVLSWAGDRDVVGGDDCDDADDAVFPGADEICDGQYNNCEDHDYDDDGAPAEEEDGDGDYRVDCHYVAADWVGYSGIVGGDDCDDTDKMVYEGAEEICDGRYNDCGDPDYDVLGAPEDEGDGDLDGFVVCVGYDDDDWTGDPDVGGDGDCDDSDGTVYPGAEEICDGQYNDCDDLSFDATSAPEAELDGDGDGYVSCETSAGVSWAGDEEPTGGDDCDDSDDGRYPGASEACNGAYDDCTALGVVFGYSTAPADERDNDGDDYVECSGYSAATWIGDDASIIGGDDCDDGDAGRYPGADEVCNGQYDDCEDPAFTALDAPADEWDDDGDGYIECVRYHNIDWNPYDEVTVAPRNDEDGCVDESDCVDCDDEDPATWPGSAELDDTFLCMRDADDDGYGDSLGEDPVEAGTDCDDADAEVYPTHPEDCEEDEQVDSDCDGDFNTWYNQDTEETEYTDDGSVSLYLDADGDGFGTDEEGGAVVVCDYTDGYSSQPTDCEDDDPSRHPGATELCNDIDDDCDLDIDESEDLDPELSGCVDMYRDTDLDGYGDYEVSACLCRTGGESEIEDRGDLYVLSGGDCNDNDAGTHPLSCEDGLDNDGDGTLDNDGATGADPDCLRGLDEYGSAVERKLETFDGDDNDCDGYVPAVELDCDDDGSMPALPIARSSASTSDEVGLSTCGDSDALSTTISCWEEDALSLSCDPASGFWMLRYAESADGYAGRFDGGARVYRDEDPDTRCDSDGDCDDHCASRCPGETESCDSVDNDCTNADAGDDGDLDGLPDALSDSPVLGTVADEELDLDADGYLNCEGFSADLPQQQWSAGSCADLLSDDELATDCNELCGVSFPEAEERCNGTTDTCDGAGEGTDEDDDLYATCGAWSGDDGEEIVEDVYVLVYVRPRDERGLGVGDVHVDGLGGADDSEDSASAASESEELADFVPILLPREGALGACDAGLYAQLLALPWETDAETLVDGAIQSRDPRGLVDICAERDDEGKITGWRCTLARITLDSEADERTWGGVDPVLYTAERAGFVSAECKEATEQIATRTVWSRARILEARAAVVASECLRVFGAACESLDLPTALADTWDELADSDGLFSTDQRWWMEIGRYRPEAVDAGTLMTCWGDPTDDLEVAETATGGDCADGRESVNRDQYEGPGDVVFAYAQMYGDDPNLEADCSLCLDGVDNNCDGSVDCADPTCAICFVGQGSGCGGGEQSPCASGGCATVSQGAVPPEQLAWMGAVVGLSAVVRRRRQ